MKIDEYMARKYGPIMDYGELAKLLRRTPSGLRYTLSQSTAPYAQKLRAARVQIGKRIYFKTSDISALIDNADDDDREVTYHAS